MAFERSDWHERYHTTSPNVWHGRKDGPGAPRFHEVVQVLNLNNGLSSLQKGIALIGFACDEGIKRNQGRVGAAKGPEALREALGKLAFHGNAPVYDLGDVVCTDGHLEASQIALAAIVAKTWDAGLMPIVLGGGHEVAWGHYQGLASAYPSQRMGIINIDAHYDLRPCLAGQGSSGTSFTQIAQHRQALGLPFEYACIGIQPLGNTQALFETALQLGVETVTASDIYQQGIGQALATVDYLISKCEVIYLTLCMDVFGSAFAPGVSAPQPLGMMPWQVQAIVAHVRTSGKLIGFDVAELSPPFDRDSHTAMLAAAMVATITLV